MKFCGATIIAASFAGTAIALPIPKGPMLNDKQLINANRADTPMHQKTTESLHSLVDVVRRQQTDVPSLAGPLSNVATAAPTGAVSDVASAVPATGTGTVGDTIHAACTPPTAEPTGAGLDGLGPVAAGPAIPAETVNDATAAAAPKAGALAARALPGGDAAASAGNVDQGATDTVESTDGGVPSDLGDAVKGVLSVRDHLSGILSSASNAAKGVPGTVGQDAGI